MTLQEFSAIYALLSAQLRNTDLDVPVVKSYHKVLGDLEVEFVAMAAERFAKGVAVQDDGQAWFPKAPEWRALALKVEREREDALRAQIKRLPAPLCRDCDDTSWRAIEGDRRAVVPCECRSLRRLEVLGRRPMPTLHEAPAATAAVIDIDAAAKRLASTKGMA